MITQALALVPALSAFGVLRVLRAGRALRAVVVVAHVVAVGGTVREVRPRRPAPPRRQLHARRRRAHMDHIRGRVHTRRRRRRADASTRSADAIWWSSATNTTVGYGDVFPITTTGRVVGVITMVVGISTFAVVTAKVAEFLVHSDA